LISAKAAGAKVPAAFSLPVSNAALTHLRHNLATDAAVDSSPQHAL